MLVVITFQPLADAINKTFWGLSKMQQSKKAFLMPL